MFKDAEHITINVWCNIVFRKKYGRKCTAGKINTVHALPNVPTKATFNVCVRTPNFKITYVRVVLCTCAPSVHKFCNPQCFPNVISK